MRHRCLAIVLAAAPLVACGDKSPTGPSTPPAAVSRMWTGTVTDDLNGSAALRIDASGRGDALIGTWSVRSANGDKGGQALVNLTTIRSGTATFILNPAAATVCANPLFSTLAGAFLLQLTGTENALSGGSIYYSCDGIVFGRVEITGQ